MSQAHDLHRALLRPAIIHILRAAGFHSTRPSVLDTLTNIAERYILLLASTTVQHAYNAHNDPVPTITDVRMALTDCAVLLPSDSAAEEEWRELMRVPIAEMGASAEKGGQRRMAAEKRKRDERDLQDVTAFKRWISGGQHAEIRRVAGLMPDASATGAMPAVGVGGGVVQAEDFLTVLRKKHGKAGQDDSRLVGTVLGGEGEEREVVIEGGPVQRIRDWRPRNEERSENTLIAGQTGGQGKAKASARSSSGSDGDSSMTEADAVLAGS
ncbi:hypothetical protein B0A50_08040 [Salinomyces thailandicus]|uniref:Bromodomain associated domain-containing protein n=1 Tax=Salinomyces thailandicus TaxID=706561 RepID=A0A4U0TKZ9_9PEZI|nr:hypothetical protein B0A50_08040 [Salinomyces thailandica]